MTHKKSSSAICSEYPYSGDCTKDFSSEEACDRYIKGFKKVLKLHGDGIPVENIASELEISKSLVRQYVEIIEDLAQTRKE